MNFFGFVFCLNLHVKETPQKVFDPFDAFILVAFILKLPEEVVGVDPETR